MTGHSREQRREYPKHQPASDPDEETSTTGPTLHAVRGGALEATFGVTGGLSALEGGEES